MVTRLSFDTRILLSKKGEEASMSRIRSLLRAAHEGAITMMGKDSAPEPVANATYYIRLHALAIAAEHGLPDYAEYKGAVGEDEVLKALPKLDEAALAGLNGDLQYIARYSHFESVRIAVSFYLDA
jgi:hypothetical protein